MLREETRVAATHARVCIGIPVYNGQAYIAETLRAALGQTYPDLEVVVGDNASTDDTARICREFAERDPRVRYVRFDEHVGVAASFTRTFGLCHSEYFKWAASDDLFDATFVAKCLSVLEESPGAVVCYTEAAVCDAQGRIVMTDDFMLDLSVPSPSQRFRRLVFAPPKRHGAHEQYGVIRADALRQAGAMSTAVYGDRVLLAQLTLLGMLVRVPEVLFFNRDHEGRSQRDGRRRARPGSILTRRLGAGPWPPSEFWDPRRRGHIVFPEWSLAGHYALVALRSSVSVPEKIRCLLAVAEMMVYRSPKYGRDLLIATEQAVRLVRAGRPPWTGGLEALTAGDQGRPTAA